MDDCFIHRIGIEGYRSIRALTLRLGQLNVVTGSNGSGKSNLYRALRLLAATSQGRLVASLAAEGGLGSVLWAGPETITAEMKRGEIPIQGTMRSKPVALKLGFSAEPFSYCFDLGLPAPSSSMFSGDPELKRECLWRGLAMEAKSLCADRRGSSLRCRGERGKWQNIEIAVASQASMLTEYADPYAAPELVVMRQLLGSWRFYDTFRTDADSPARQIRPGSFTPIMSGSGNDFAAAFQTIREIGDAEQQANLVDAAFPGCKVQVANAQTGIKLTLKQPGMLRDLSAAELSDGTLRYLLLLTALLTPRPPSLIVLNEPENSLHPDLIPALAQLILHASTNSQMIVVTHSPALVEALETDPDCVSIHLQKECGETVIESDNLLDRVGWKWPPR